MSAYRRESSQCQTFLHGDSHFWKFLFHRNKVHPPILIDWQTWNTGFGAEELTYMIAMHWFPERRNRYEEPLLQHYLTTLHREGIEYSMEDLWYDYRMSLIGWLVDVTIF